MVPSSRLAQIDCNLAMSLRISLCSSTRSFVGRCVEMWKFSVAWLCHRTWRQRSMTYACSSSSTPRTSSSAFRSRRSSLDCSAISTTASSVRSKALRSSRVSDVSVFNRGSSVQVISRSL